MRLARIVVGGLLILGTSDPVTAQQDTVASRTAVGAVAFVNVNLIRMNSERVEPGQTVIVSANRIATIGVSPGAASTTRCGHTVRWAIGPPAPEAIRPPSVSGLFIRPALS